MTSNDRPERSYSWADDPYWVDALDRFVAMRDAGAKTIDINAFEQPIFNGDGPAYRLLYAMESVMKLEGEDGFRGAPRLTLALLQILKELR